MYISMMMASNECMFSTKVAGKHPPHLPPAPEARSLRERLGSAQGVRFQNAPKTGAFLGEHSLAFKNAPVRKCAGKHIVLVIE